MAEMVSDVSTEAFLTKEPTIATQERYGWKGFKPSGLQWLNRPAWFLFFTCVAMIAQGMCVGGLIGVTISTLEQRFALSSTETSLICAFYEFFSIPALVVVGYFGAKCDRPKWIGCGMLIMFLGCLLYAVPHFTTQMYQYADVAYDNLCHFGENSSEFCPPSITTTSESSNYLYVFIASTCLLAIGSQPLLILSVTYLDDSISRHDSSIYLGVFFSVGSIGSAIAYIGGGYLLDFYTDIDVQGFQSPSLGPADPRWVGAWWIGFLITAALALFTVLPLIGFPHHMLFDTSKEDRNLETYHSDSSEDVYSTQPTFRLSLQDMTAALKILVKNPTFIFANLSAVCDLVIGTGFVNFAPKFLENEFSIPASKAAIICGIMVVCGAAGGSIVGSVFVKKFKMDCSACLRGTVITSLVAMATFTSFFIQCDNAPFYGVNIGANSTLLPSPCLSQCECSPYHYEPVCGADNVTYFSPCYAGCQDVKDGSKYNNCSCLNADVLMDTGVPVEHSAVSGLCPVDGCVVLPLFCCMLFLGMFAMLIEAMFHVQVLLRCVPQTHRSIAMGIYSIVARIMCSFPANMLFGASLDQSCLLWEESCSVSRGSCLYYDNTTMAMYMMLLCGTAKLFSTIFSFCGWRCYQSKKNPKSAMSTQAKSTETKELKQPADAMILT